MKKTKSQSNPSEVQAYVYIIKELIDKKGWLKSQIYIQGECHKNPEIKKYLGQTKPENIVEINEKLLYVIESKNERKKIDTALKEAREDYADKINQGNKVKALFITGIAGNDEEGFIAKSQFYKNEKWEDITENEIAITGLLSKKQVEDIIKNKNFEFKTKHYTLIDNADLDNSNKIIICGTSLKDDKFLKNLDKFNWIRKYKKPILGICGGMQIINLVFGGKLKQKREIGFYKEKFKRNFLGLEGEKEVYHLHNNYLSLPRDFSEFTISKIPQAIKHKTKQIYGVLFHPEVRNKIVVERFVVEPVNKNLLYPKPYI